MARATSKTEPAERDSSAAELRNEAAELDRELRESFERQYLHEALIARRLYEVWRTVGQLTDAKWEYEKQSDRSHQAWLAVARAASPFVLGHRFGPYEIAQVNHG